MRALPKSIIYIMVASIMANTYAQTIPVDPNNVYEQTTDVSADVPEDMDYDGMPNWWELFYGLNPTDPTDAGIDSDNDKLTNLEEYNYGTNPKNRDTDNGGVLDGNEIIEGKNPLDGNDDFIPIKISGDPRPPADIRGDSDGDGISNIDEDLYGTNKHSVDTDADGLNDFEELFLYRTNPLEQDTDFDGINDYAELKTYGTNPVLNDTDFDGLFDGSELYVHKTNPTIWDTDGGGVSDFDEIQNNSDPLDQQDDFELIWIVYYGEKPNELFHSLERNKIDIFQGLNLTLEAIKPKEAKSLTLEFNSKTFTTEKELVKLKIISPEKEGLYTLKLFVELNSGQIIKLTRYIEVKKPGEVIRKADGQFNNIYSKFNYFDNQLVTNAKVEILKLNPITEQLELFTSDIFSQDNPLITNAKGSYITALHPGNYLIKVSKPNIGSKEILLETDTYTLYSESVYLTYNYDFVIWTIIFLSLFLLIWNTLQIIDFFRIQTRKYIENKASLDIKK